MHKTELGLNYARYTCRPDKHLYHQPLTSLLCLYCFEPLGHIICAVEKGCQPSVTSHLLESAFPAMHSAPMVVQHCSQVLSLQQGYVIAADPVNKAPGADKERSPLRKPVFGGKMVQLAASPELYLLKDFLSDAEADHLIKKVHSLRVQAPTHGHGIHMYSLGMG